MRKELSLNTQLISLREAISLLKQATTQATTLDLTYGGTRAHTLQQLIYSLRDIKYRLSGLKYKVSRSSQERRIGIDEICNMLQHEFEREEEEQYALSLQHAHGLLQNVQRYMHLKPTAEDRQEEIDNTVVKKFMIDLEAHNFPILTKNQYDILHSRLLQRLKDQQDELF